MGAENPFRKIKSKDKPILRKQAQLGDGTTPEQAIVQVGTGGLVIEQGQTGSIVPRKKDYVPTDPTDEFDLLLTSDEPDFETIETTHPNQRQSLVEIMNAGEGRIQEIQRTQEIEGGTVQAISITGSLKTVDPKEVEKLRRWEQQNPVQAEMRKAKISAGLQTEKSFDLTEDFFEDDFKLELD